MSLTEIINCYILLYYIHLSSISAFIFRSTLKNYLFYNSHHIDEG